MQLNLINFCSSLVQTYNFSLFPQLVNPVCLLCLGSVFTACHLWLIHHVELCIA